MRLGIMGTGMIAQEVLTFIHEVTSEPIVICGREQSRDKVEHLVKEFHLERSYYDYEEMLAADIDTVYIALPNHLHFSYAKTALQYGKHVILEKPVTPTLAELQELKKLAAEKQVILVEAMTVHYLPIFEDVREEVKHLGEIKIVSLNFSQYSSRYDAFKRGQIQPVFDPKQAGGVLMDLNVYNIHAVVGLFGRPKNVSYSANVQRGIDTSGVLLLDYGSFKAVCIGAKDCTAPIMSTIQGDAGYIVLREPVSRLTEYECADNKGSSEKFTVIEKKNRMYYEFLAFKYMIEEQDFLKADEMMRISEMAVEVIETARRQAGIVL
jgi:predicted dehydrogenase